MSDIGAVWRTFSPDEPLPPDDPRYVDLTSVRGGKNFALLLSNRIIRSEDPSVPPDRRRFHTQLFTGHNKCGKTTELLRLRQRLEKAGYLVVFFDTERGVGRDFEYTNLLLLLAQELVEQLHERGVQVKDELVQEMLDLLERKEVVDTRAFKLEPKVGVEVGGETGTALSLFTKAMAALRVDLGGGYERAHEVSRKIEPDVGRFIETLNLLIDDAQVRLRRQGFNGLVVIADGLDKLIWREGRDDGPSNHEVFFVGHAEQLQAPRCHLIYTVPVSLLYNTNLPQVWGEVDLVPAVRVKERRSQGGRPFQPGRDALHRIVERRLEALGLTTDDLFTEDDILDRFVALSGGHVADLLRLVRYALDYTEDRIGPAQARSAERDFLNVYSRLITERDLEALVTVARTQELPGDPRYNLLLYKLLVLEYVDDEGRWADLHPAAYAAPLIASRLSQTDREAK